MKGRGLVLFVLLAAAWGIPYALIKVALRGFEPEVVVFGRFLIGALMLAPLAVRSGALRALRGRELEIVALAAVQIALPITLITVGERWVSSSLAGTLVSTTPLFVALLALRVDQAERPSRRNAAGLALGIAGVGLMLGLDLGGGRPLLGGAFVLVAALCYAIGALATRRRFTGIPPVVLATGTLSSSALLLAVPAALSLPDHVPARRADRRGAGARRRLQRARLPAVLRPDRPGRRVARGAGLVRRTGVRGARRRRVPRRAAERGRRRRPRADPVRLVARQPAARTGAGAAGRVQRGGGPGSLTACSPSSSA